MEPNIISYPPVVSSDSVSKPQGSFSLFEFAWDFFKTHWRFVAPLMIFPSIVMYVGNIFGIFRNVFVNLIGVVFLIVGLVLAIVMQTAVVNAVHRLSKEPTVALSFRGQYKLGFSYFWSVAFLMALQLLIGLGTFVFLFIPAVIVGVYTGLYLFVRVLDDKKGLTALLETYSLVKGRWWAVFGRILFMGLINLACAVVISIASSIFGAIIGIDAKSTAGMIVAIIMGLVLAAVIGPISLAYTYKLYMSLKSTRFPNVSVLGFKRWLVAFLVVGVIMAISLPWVLESSFVEKQHDWNQYYMVTR
jgi:hypothetical protein